MTDIKAIEDKLKVFGAMMDDHYLSHEVFLEEFGGGLSSVQERLDALEGRAPVAHEVADAAIHRVRKVEDRLDALEHKDKVGTKNDTYHERRLDALEHDRDEHEDRLDELEGRAPIMALDEETAHAWRGAASRLSAIEDRLDAMEGREFLGEFVATPKTEGELLCTDREKVRVYAVPRDDADRREREAYAEGRAHEVSESLMRERDAYERGKAEVCGSISMDLKIMSGDRETTETVGGFTLRQVAMIGSAIAHAEAKGKREGIAEGRELEKADVLREGREFASMACSFLTTPQSIADGLLNIIERNDHRRSWT